jgi:hypothetical protein
MFALIVDPQTVRHGVGSAPFEAPKTNRLFRI